VTVLLWGQLVVTASKRILIVEDDRSVAQTMALLLSERGYDVKSVRSAEEGFSTFEVWQPDLAILDVFLPDQNGVEMAIALRSEYPGLKILLFSGVPDTQALLEQARRRGYEFEILAKPVHPKVVFEHVEALLA
jgi:DNA-binding response OmpR family regulator